MINSSLLSAVNMFKTHRRTPVKRLHAVHIARGINLLPFMSPHRSTYISAGWTYGSVELSEVGYLLVSVIVLSRVSCKQTLTGPQTIQQRQKSPFKKRRYTNNNNNKIFFQSILINIKSRTYFSQIVNSLRDLK